LRVWQWRLADLFTPGPTSDPWTKPFTPSENERVIGYYRQLWGEDVAMLPPTETFLLLRGRPTKRKRAKLDWLTERDEAIQAAAVQLFETEGGIVRSRGDIE